MSKLTQPRLATTRSGVVVAAALALVMVAVAVAVPTMEQDESTGTVVFLAVLAAVWSLGAIWVYRAYRQDRARDREVAQSRVEPELPSVEAMASGRDSRVSHAAGVREALRWSPPSGPLLGRGDAVCVEHVDQGTLGNCGFVAALGALTLAEPARVRQLVEDRGDCIVVHLPRASVQLTRHLPLVNGEPAFAASDDDSVLWPAYVEKAAAVLFGGYDALYRISPELSFQLLVGTPGTKPRVLLGQRALLRQCDGSRPVVAVMADHVDGHHAYVVTSCSSTGDTIELHLHNPWGRDHRLVRGPMRAIRQQVVSLHAPGTTLLTTWRRTKK